jgi:hypothetical protein
MTDKYHSQLLRLYISHFILTKTGYSHINLSALDILAELFELIFVGYVNNVIEIPIEELNDILPMRLADVVNESKEEKGNEVNETQQKTQEVANETVNADASTFHKKISNPFASYGKVTEIKCPVIKQENRSTARNVVTTITEDKEKTAALEALCAKLPKRQTWAGRLLAKSCYVPNPPSVKSLTQKQSSFVSPEATTAPRSMDGMKSFIKEAIDQKPSSLGTASQPTVPSTEEPAKIKIRFTLPKIVS